MKQQRGKAEQIKTGLRPVWRIRPIAAACSALLLPSVSAYADETQQIEKIETIVVTGIRGSIESSIATKRDSDSIVEAITAEDIGKLPDISIAESLARLPGVAAQRVDGRAQVLSIRGMAPKFGVTLINGREIVSTGDDRSFEYDQFPSELVNAATVYKTPDASLGTQGLAGTVNLMTVSPLDFNESKVSLNARMDKNSFGELVPGSDNMGNRLSASYIDQFADRTVGVALGLAHLDSPNQKKYFNPWDFGKASDLGVNGVGGSDYTFNGFEAGVASTQTKRDGVMAVVEYRPNKNFRSQFDVFHSEFEERMNARELIGVLANWGAAYSSVVSPLANGGVGGTVTNGVPLITQRKNNRDDKVDAIGWNNELKIDKWTTVADLSYSRAKRHEWIGEAYALGASPISYSVQFPSSLSGFGSIGSSFDFSNAANYRLASAWWGGGAYVGVADVKDDTKSARFSAKRELDWGPVSSFDGGVLFSERTKDMAYVGTDYSLNGGTSCYSDFTCAAIPGGILQSPANLGFAGISGIPSFDVMSALASGAYTANTGSSKSPTWNWGVSEKVTTAFAKLGLDFQAGIPVRGNVGMQVINAKQDATGLYEDSNGDLNPISGGTRYTDVLPSLNLIAELTGNTFLRFGAAKVIARPNMADMRAGTTASVGTTDHMWSGSGGNPKLEPWRADAYDLSLEKYLSKGTYVAAAVFEKHIKTGILTKDVQYDFSGYTNTSGITPLSNIGTLTTPTNVSGGFVRGWELSGALEASVISKELDGFGLLGSYSRTSSNLPGTDATGAPTNTSLEGLSGDVWGLTAYYEKNGFQARVAQRYRSAFTAIRHNAFKLVTDSIQPEKITDLQLSYEMQSGPYKGLSLLFQVNNLTNTPYVVTQTVDGNTAMKEYQEFGRQLLLGLSYKL
jgi:iron complex outermembrane recepter protein